MSSRHLSATAALAALLLAAVPAAATVQTVTPDNIDIDWFERDTRPGGSNTFAEGPAAPPFGSGSLHVATSGGSAKAQMFTDQFGEVLEDGSPNPAFGGNGIRLADIDGISYWAYRSAASTNPAAQTLSLNMEIRAPNEDLGFATLVYEPIYNAALSGPIVPGIWQFWDAFSDGNARWWSTRDLPGGICRFDCFVPWSQIVAAVPSARILRFFGFNAGSGWAGNFSGAADGLTLSADGEGAWTFDFEVRLPVRIILKPGGSNKVNTNAKQLVSIAIMGAPGFDPATMVDAATVRVRDAEPSLTRFDEEDVDGDGHLDLVLYFRAREFDKPSSAECNDPDARIELTGETFAGTAISGDDAVEWIGPDCK